MQNIIIQINPSETIKLRLLLWSTTEEWPKQEIVTEISTEMETAIKKLINVVNAEGGEITFSL